MVYHLDIAWGMDREVVKRVGRERVAREEQRVEEVDLAERRERLVTRMEVESMIILLGGPYCRPCES